ncbi:MAG: hypothetical protein Tsb0020_23710 [Haliangiales bacterium]
MRLGIRTRLFLASFLLLTASGLAISLYVRLTYHAWVEESSAGTIQVLAEVLDSGPTAPIWLVLGLSLVGALLLSSVASHWLSRTLRELSDSAHSIADGTSQGRIEVESADDLEGLPGSLNRLADDIEKTVSELASERARFKAVLEGMNEAVVSLDSARCVMLMNPAAMGLLNIDEVGLAQPLIELVRAPALHQLLIPTVRAGTCEFELPTKPPRRVLARVTPSSVLGSDCIIVMHDVTSIRQLETVRRDFVANVSHELRTPVSIISANVETLLDGAMEDPVHGRRLLDALHRTAERLSRLVSDLLDLSRLEANRYRIASDTVGVEAAVRQALSLVERSAEAKDIRIDLEIPKDLNVRADDKALDQILVNYLDNAIKYTARAGKIVISARARGDMVRIEVADNGPGIAPQHRARIFERFYRVDPGRSRDMGGTGLGLSIVKHLAVALDGDAGMEPVEPNGSAFWVSLRRA